VIKERSTTDWVDSDLKTQGVANPAKAEQNKSKNYSPSLQLKKNQKNASHLNASLFCQVMLFNMAAI
jgi:hypothetical protein